MPAPIVQTAAINLGLRHFPASVSAESGAQVVSLSNGATIVAFAPFANFSVIAGLSIGATFESTAFGPANPVSMVPGPFDLRTESTSGTYQTSFTGSVNAWISYSTPVPGQGDELAVASISFGDFDRVHTDPQVLTVPGDASHPAIGFAEDSLDFVVYLWSEAGPGTGGPRFVGRDGTVQSASGNTFNIVDGFAAVTDAAAPEEIRPDIVNLIGGFDFGSFVSGGNLIGFTLTQGGTAISAPVTLATGVEVSSTLDDAPNFATMQNGGFAAIFTANSDLQVQRYDASGAAVGARIVLTGLESAADTATAGANITPQILELPDGRFMVAVAGVGIWGQMINADGTLDGGPFQIASAPNANSASVDLAIMWDGRVAVSYTIDSADGGDAFLTILDPRESGIDLDGTGDRDYYVGSRFGDIIDGFGGDDTLFGGAGNDTLRGGDGFGNLLVGGAGADTLDGRGGNSIMSYQDATAGVYYVFTDLGNATGDARGDLPIAINAIWGSDFNDVIGIGEGNNSLRGLGGDDWLWGQGGDDVLDGGTGGDILFGGAGSDTISYQNAATGIYLVFTDFGNRTGESMGDTLISVENINGSQFGDILGIGEDDNCLFGAGGDDILLGQGGNDTIDGGQGDDVHWGGTGADRFRFSGVEAFFGDRDSIADFEDGVDRVDFTGSGFTFSSFTFAAVSGGVEASYGTNGAKIFIAGVTLGQITAADFIF